MFPAYCDKALIFVTLILVIYSSVMVASAAMGEGAGDTGVVTRTFQRQILFSVAGIFCMVLVIRMDLLNFFELKHFNYLYWAVVALLLSCRFFKATYGAYAWIRLGALSVQPSEFAKVFMLLYAAKIFEVDSHRDNLWNAYVYIAKSLVLFGIILVIQKDLGSATVLLGMCFIMLLIVPYRELNKIRKWMLITILFVIIAIVIIMLPVTNTFLEKHSSS